MKRSRIISAVLLLTMLFSLCACGTDCTPTVTAAPTPAQPAATATPAPTPIERPMVTGYIAAELPTPDWVKAWGSCDIADDTFYIGTETADGGVAVTAFDTLSETFHRYDIDTSGLHNAHSLYISAVNNSVWVYVYEARTLEEIRNNANVGEMRDFIAHIDLTTGEQTLSEITFWEESFNMPMYLIAMDDEKALFGNSSITEIEGAKGYNNFVIDTNANVIARPEVDILGNAQRVRVNETLYLATAEGLATFDTETLQYGAAIGAIINRPVLYSSACGNFLVTKDNALYAIDPTDGAETEVFKWADVALSFSRLYGQKGLENKNGDIYHLTDRITKITTGQIPLKETLTLACFGDTNSYGYPANGGSFGSSDKSYVCSDSLLDAIIRFNNSDPDYKIEIKPYIYSSDEERTRLLIDLATSGGADILDTSLLPDGAAGSSILVDMLPYLDADDELNREDFIPGIFADMTKNGGMYEYVDRYDLITVTTSENFANGADWTAARMCELVAQYPELCVECDEETLKYNFAWAASAEFMDYDTLTCNFDSETFMEWLKLLKKLAAVQQDGYSIDYAFYIDCQFPAHVGMDSRTYARGEYVPVGFPNTEGNGSYFMRYNAPTAFGRGSFLDSGQMTYGAVNSVGIMASGDNKDGAWRFVKTFMRGSEDVNLSNGIPAQKAVFERAVENALNKEQGESVQVEQFNARDAEYIRALVYSTDKCVSDSDSVIDTIRTILTAYLGGRYTESDAAKQLQSRMTIYLAEQYK